MNLFEIAFSEWAPWNGSLEREVDGDASEES